MARLLLRRALMAIPTLLAVTVVVFLFTQILPGDVGRAVLGRFATNQQVHLLDRSLGLYEPLPLRYWHWLKGFVTGDWGNSLLLQVPVLPLVFSRIWNSTQLALVAMIIIYPFSIAMGVFAGIRENGIVDRLIATFGLSLTAIPEFVSGIILIAIFGVSLKLLPITAQSPPGASVPEHVYYLLLPALPIMFVLFGYIARHARSGTREVTESNYYRSAVLKGLPKRRILVSHVLPNALLPTITVLALQVGYLIGGLVVVETLFNYPGIGLLLLNSAIGKDVPVIEDVTVILGAIIVLANLLADASYSLLNPRVRLAVS